MPGNEETADSWRQTKCFRQESAAAFFNVGTANLFHATAVSSFQAVLQSCDADDTECLSFLLG